MNDYYPVNHDNRLTETNPCGFVYLAPRGGGEVVGRVGYGASRSDPRPLAVWPTRETPTDMTRESLSRVEAYLARAFPALAV